MVWESTIGEIVHRAMQVSARTALLADWNRFNDILHREWEKGVIEACLKVQVEGGVDPKTGIDVISVVLAVVAKYQSATESCIIE